MEEDVTTITIEKEECIKILDHLQQYVPHLEKLIAQLKDPKWRHRELELNKLECLHSMITDRKKRLKLDTLRRCEDKILRILNKVYPTIFKQLQPKSEPHSSVNMIKFVCKDPPEEHSKISLGETDEFFNLQMLNTARACLSEVAITPASPSPPRDTPLVNAPHAPIVIPTEMIPKVALNPNEFHSKKWDVETRANLSRPYIESYETEKSDCYSSVAESLTSSSSKKIIFDRLGTKVDMPIPPLSAQDLQQLTAPERKNLLDLRTKLTRENPNKMRDREHKAYSTIKPVLLPPRDEEQKVQLLIKSLPVPPPVSSFKPKSPQVQKIFKNPDSKFGNLLSSIDEQILGDNVVSPKISKKKDQTSSKNKAKAKEEKLGKSEHKREQDSNKDSMKEDHHSSDKKDKDQRADKKEKDQKVDQKEKNQKADKNPHKDDKKEQKDCKNDKCKNDKEVEMHKSRLSVSGLGEVADETMPQEDNESDTEFIEPDKNYYFDPHDKSECKLCSFKGEMIVQHYKTNHAKHEVLISRISPDNSITAIEESIENGYEDIEVTYTGGVKNRRKRFTYQCRFCQVFFKNENSESFFDHLTGHTGEYRFICSFCPFMTAYCKSLRAHMHSLHNATVEHSGSIMPTYQAPPNFHIVFGYICAECNFIQMDKTAVETHVKIYHLGGNKKIYKINMSTIVLKPTEVPEVNAPAEVGEISKKSIDKQKHEKMKEINKTIIPKKKFTFNLLDKIKSRLDDRHMETVAKETENNDSSMQFNSSVDAIINSSKKNVVQESFASKKVKSDAKCNMESNVEKPIVNKTSVPISNIIERLQGKLNVDVAQPPPVIPVNNFEPEQEEVIARVGPVGVTKKNCHILYFCYKQSCMFSSTIESEFAIHCKNFHGTQLWDGFCNICNINTSFMEVEEAYNHLLSVHKNDFEADEQTAAIESSESQSEVKYLRMRSGNKLLENRLDGSKSTDSTILSNDESFCKIVNVESHQEEVLESSHSFPFHIANVTTLMPEEEQALNAPEITPPAAAVEKVLPPLTVINTVAGYGDITTVSSCTASPIAIPFSLQSTSGSLYDFVVPLMPPVEKSSPSLLVPVKPSAPVPTSKLASLGKAKGPSKKCSYDKDKFVVLPKLKEQKNADSSSGISSNSSSAADEANKQVPANLIRHFQFHCPGTEAPVPAIAPVNPVPCLEKNKKVFDNMTNLALSSFIETRLASKVEKKEKSGLSKEEEAQLPVFVPAVKRYVCGASYCDYLCLEESILRYHLQALHSNEPVYKCTHCSEKLSSEKGVIDVDNIIKHLRLHDLHLYKCSDCKFLHNLKHKVERHVFDKHTDKPASVIIVREIEYEPEEQHQAHYEEVKEAKPWHCGMCNYRCTAKKEIIAHVYNKHYLKTQHKCAQCKFLSNEIAAFTDHFQMDHPGQNIAVIDAYYEVGATSVSSKNASENLIFDTTPLSQRDKNKFKHIRSIPLDETNKSPKKSSAKPFNSLDNLDKAIEAFASGVTHVTGKDITSLKPKKSKTLKEKELELINDGSNDVIEIDDDVVDVTSVNSENKKVEGKEKYSFKLNIDELVIQKVEERVKSVRLEDENPVTPSMREIEKMDVSTLRNTELSGTYGSYGKPFNKQFVCPLCGVFKTKKAEDVTYHLYKELHYPRFVCTSCGLTGITYNFLQKHSAKKHINLPEAIHPLSPDSKVEDWVQKVLLVQRRLMSDNENLVFNTTLKDEIKNKDPAANNKSCYLQSVVKEPLKSASVNSSGFNSIEEINSTSNSSSSFDADSSTSKGNLHHCHWAQKSSKCAHSCVEGVTNYEVIQQSKGAHLGMGAKKGSVRYKCCYCNTIGPMEMIKRHFQIEHPGINFAVFQYKCPHCSDYFKCIDTLKAHCKIVHNDSDPVALDIEELLDETSNKPKDYVCKYCGMEFEVHQEIVDHHKAVHFHLDMNLPLDLTMQPAAQSKKEDEMKKYMCSHNSNSFVGISDHIRAHDKTFQCYYCSYRNSYPYRLRSHQKKEHPNLEFKCKSVEEAKEMIKNRRENLVVREDDSNRKIRFKKGKRATSDQPAQRSKVRIVDHFEYEAEPHVE